MIALIAMAIGFGAVAGFSPTKLAIALLYLGGRVAPVARAVSFTIANTAVMAAIAGLGFAGDTLVDDSGVPPTAADLIDIAVGLTLLAIAAYGLARPGAVGPATLGVGDSDLRPRLGRALVFGATYAFVSFGRLIIMAIGGSWIARSPVGPTAQAVLLVTMLVVAQLMLWFPIVISIVAPARLVRLQGLTDRSLQHAGGRTSAIVVLIIGSVLVFSGLDWLF